MNVVHRHIFLKNEMFYLKKFISAGYLKVFLAILGC